MGLLTVLAGLPVSGTMCAMLCELASSAAATHHGTGQECEKPAQSSDGPQVGGQSEHDCSLHNGAIRLASTTAAERTGAATKSVPLMIGAVPIAFDILRDSQTLFDYRSPPDPAPPTVTPLVLRV